MKKTVMFVGVALLSLMVVGCCTCAKKGCCANCTPGQKCVCGCAQQTCTCDAACACKK